MTQFPTPTTDRDTSQLIDDQAEGEGGPSDWKTSNFWTFAFYQQFFDIDTVDVKNRVMYSMVPMPGKSFLQYHIRPRPDLYGPFWVCVTLVFSIAISGNMSDYLQKSFQPWWCSPTPVCYLLVSMGSCGGLGLVKLDHPRYHSLSFFVSMATVSPSTFQCPYFGWSRSPGGSGFVFS